MYYTNTLIRLVVAHAGDRVAFYVYRQHHQRFLLRDTCTQCKRSSESLQDSKYGQEKLQSQTADKAMAS